MPASPRKWWWSACSPQEGITRQQLGREEFERRVWEWKEKYGNRIIDQMKRIGDSVDWSRERFTLVAGALARRARSVRAPA